LIEPRCKEAVHTLISFFKEPDQYKIAGDKTPKDYLKEEIESDRRED
jgi:hypothetical protein